MVKIMENSPQPGELDDDLFEDEDTQKDKYLTFHLAKEDYGIEICFVTEIIGVQEITELPEMPDFIKGIINLRGKVIPVMDVRARFKLPGRDYDERTCIIVVEIDKTTVGLVVDEVREVMDIPESQVEPPPNITDKKSSRFIQGVGKVENDVKIILNISQLLYEDEQEQISNRKIDAMATA
jgi:purine-binding chemotaxis protein CheW